MSIHCKQHCYLIKFVSLCCNGGKLFDEIISTKIFEHIYDDPVRCNPACYESG